MPTTKAEELQTAEGRRRLAALLAAARQEFVSDIACGHGGTAAHTRFAGRIDHLVAHIVDVARAHTRTPLAVMALGGYGHRTLCLHSDVDLLIVFDGRIGRPEERFVKAVLHPLWDLQLTVGHQVRVVGDFDEIERDNPEFLLALLDVRLLAGDPAVLAGVQERLRRSSAGRRDHVLEALLRLTDRRHAQFNDTIYQLEPDLKEAPGGLRDLAGSRALAILAERPLAANAEAERLAEAEDFLLRLRAVLHLETGRNLNILSHDLQERAAERLGYQGGQPRRRVEALMGHYFGQARAVARTLERARKRAGPACRDSTRVPVGANLELTADGMGFVDLAQAASEPAAWLTAFEAAVERNVPVAHASLSLLEQHGGRYSAVDFLPGAGDRERLLRFLRPRPGLSARLAEMHDCGLLSRLFPEFRAIACRVVRDFYHKYTVDEHTLLAIRGLERLCVPEHSSRARFSSVLAELHGPERLVLALLFHDVGKWRDDDHAEESVRMAQAMLDRLGLTPEARQEVEFLIGQHLQMSRMAFLRDSEDPSVVRQFAQLVGTEERLKMLCLMTLVDIEAVGAGTLTPWKEELLWRLYVDTYNQLTLGYGDEVIESGQAAVATLQATRPVDFTEEELARFLEGFPRRYLALFDAEQVYRHARLSRDIRPDEVHLFLESKREVWELSVVTLDKPYLFANISGVLSYFGMDILRGTAMTSPTGLVLDVFQFSDQEEFFRLNPDGPLHFEKVLQDVVAGRQELTVLLRRKEAGLGRRRGSRRVTPVVHFDNEHSQRYTVLEIVAQDGLGLLHRISRVISRHGCDVDLVLISTEGNKAIDVFHLTKGAAKLAGPARTALQRELEQMLEEGYEAH
jgi:[protein-PII] uridylyltransferase